MECYLAKFALGVCPLPLPLVPCSKKFTELFVVVTRLFLFVVYCSELIILKGGQL